MRPHRNVSAVFHSSKFTKCRTRHRRSNATALPPPHYCLCLIDAVEDAVSTRRRMMMITCHTFAFTLYRESLCRPQTNSSGGVFVCLSSISILFVTRLASSLLPLLGFVLSILCLRSLPPSRSFTPSSLLITWSLPHPALILQPFISALRLFFWLPNVTKTENEALFSLLPVSFKSCNWSD